MSFPQNIECTPISYQGEIIYEVRKKGKFIYAIQQNVDQDGVEQWQMTDETCDPKADLNEIAVIGAAIEKKDL